MILPRRKVRKMGQYKPPLKNRAGMLRLDFNENTVGPSDKAVDGLKKIGRGFFSIYPEYGQLNKAIAKYANVSETQVLATNGADEAIKITMDCFVDNNDEIVLPWPSFAMFEQYALFSNGKIKRVLYNKDLSFPIKRVLKAINKRTKLVILCNPNSPTGTLIKKKDLIKIIKKAKNAIVLVDEAYYEFSGTTAAGLINRFDNLIVTRTFSKAFGLAALRIGYILTNEQNLAELKKVASPYNVTSISAILAISALRNLTYAKEYATEIRENRRFAGRELRKMGLKVFPSAGNFLLVNFGGKNNAVCNKLKERGILIRDRSGYSLLENCSRVTIGTKPQMKKFLTGLKEMLSQPLVVFDIDGVLVDVSRSYRKAIQLTARFFTGKKFSFEKIQEAKNETGLNNDWLLTKALIESAGKKVALKKIIKRFQQYYLGKNFNGFIRNEKLLVDKKVLERLREKADLCVFTGRPREEAEFALKRFGIRKFFEKLVCMEGIPKGKDKPNPFGLKIIEKEFSSREKYYLGDTLTDIECAKRAGFRAIGVLPPQDKSRKLRQLMMKKEPFKTINSTNSVLGAIG